MTKSHNVLSNHRFEMTNTAGGHKNPGEHNKHKDKKDARKEDKDMNLPFAQQEGKSY